MPEWEERCSWQRLKEDSEAREEFLAQSQTFIRHVASQACFRSLEWGRDDELSEALIAFNEAIDLFIEDKGVPFLAYARVLIKRRLIDYYRKQRLRQSISLDQDDIGRRIDVHLGLDDFREQEQNHERAEEIRQFSKALADFQLTFQDLVEASPKHRDTRETLLRAARELAFDPELWQHVERKGKVPMQALCLKTQIHPKVLERGRRYILAVALLMANQNDYVYLREYVLSREEGAKG
ncbi:RNA polymerase sigma-I factor [Desulfosporosinus sp.]|uniref:RNA polymerase sigma-I factor n=1 Tax=Desulfosporosinus sp. TaxID=157907 RepID=UPI000E97B80E|nr:RNA polymerase sigma-I factor [Desulfosporosinus sp.]MBC2724448.1 RNA polymerase sigma-I factor [Desulfosporosinus sp.]MBC2726181.1 RNA polymerase sigma-I factor [Desulfosporosinus sp.]HBV86743.1 RNA polymerase sigma-I factor [Desulfosporosinus sp.]